MNKQALKKLIEEAVLKSLNESPAWEEVEKKLGKWFKLSPGMVGNIKSLTVEPEKGTFLKSIVLHDKRGNKVNLLQGASSDFVDRYIPFITNLLTTLAGQTAERKNGEEIIFK